jgi:hypothetical protein
MTSAQDAIRLIAQRNLAAWRGLPSASLADITDAFHRHGDGVGNGRLGTHRRDYVLVAAPGYAEPLRVWLDDGERVLAIDVEYPDLPDLPAGLGTPEDRRDFHWAGLDLTGGELIYASRGITLFVNPETQELLRLAVYPAGSLQEYDSLWRLALPPHRRRPRRR